MSGISRGVNALSAESRARALKAIIAFFQDERGEEIGVIAAEEVLDFFLQDVAPEIYNRAVEDAKEAWRQNAEDGELALELLKKK